MCRRNSESRKTYPRLDSCNNLPNVCQLPMARLACLDNIGELFLIRCRDSFWHRFGRCVDSRSSWVDNDKKDGSHADVAPISCGDEVQDQRGD